MREDWCLTFTSSTGPFEDNAIEISNSSDGGQIPRVVCITTSRDGFYCLPSDLNAIIARLQKIADGCE